MEGLSEVFLKSEHTLPGAQRVFGRCSKGVKVVSYTNVTAFYWQDIATLKHGGLCSLVHCFTGISVADD
jgi:hypothetical protein